MKKITKIAMIVAACLIAAGMVTFFAAFCAFGFDISKFDTAAIEYETKTYDIEDDFTSIEVRDMESDIFIYPTDGTCRVVTKETEYIKDTVEVVNGTLKIKRRDTRKWYQHIQIGFMWSFDQAILEIYLPKSEYESLKLKAVSGDITVPAGFTFKDTELETTSGDIRFSAVSENMTKVKSVSGNIGVENITGGPVEISSTSGNVRLSGKKAGNVNIKTVSGDVRLSGLELERLEVNTTSGDMKLNDVACAKDISFDTTSGETHISSVIAGGQLKISAISGDIEIERSDAASIDINTVSGDVNGTLLSPKNFTYSTVSGDVRLPNYSDETAGSCYIKTTSGDIRISVVSD